MSQEDRSGCLSHANWAGITGIATILMLLFGILAYFVPSNEILSFLSSIHSFFMHLGNTGTSASPPTPPAPSPTAPCVDESCQMLPTSPSAPLFVQLIVGAVPPSIYILANWSEMDDWGFRRILLLVLCITIGMTGGVIAGFLFFLWFQHWFLQLGYDFITSMILQRFTAYLYEVKFMASAIFDFESSERTYDTHDWG